MTQKGKYTSKEVVVICFRLQFPVNGKLIKIETVINLVPSDYFANIYTSACGAKYAYKLLRQIFNWRNTDQITVDSGCSNKRVAKRVPLSEKKPASLSLSPFVACYDK